MYACCAYQVLSAGRLRRGPRSLQIEKCSAEGGNRYPDGAVSRQQEQPQQVGRYEDHMAPRSPGSGMSSEDLAPHLGEKWKDESPAQGPAEVGM